MSDVYKTLAAPCQGLYKDKGSRFLSFAFPVDSVEEAMGLVEDLRKRYHDARHVCFAYSVGVENPLTRSSDDGEPSGTAGRPMLGQIRSFGLDNVLVVAVRYFGGILLGTGGLTVAYKTAAQEAFSAGTTVERTCLEEFTVSFGYAVMNDVMKIVKDEKLSPVDPVYDQVCRMTLRTPKSQTERISQRLQNVEGLTIV